MIIHATAVLGTEINYSYNYDTCTYNNISYHQVKLCIHTLYYTILLNLIQYIKYLVYTSVVLQ